MKDLIETIIEVISQVLGDVYRFIFEELLNKQDHSLTASFISENEVLHKKNKGFCMTGTKNLSTKSSYNNVIISGGTGTGKSTTVLIPSILTMEGSLVILDPSGELHDGTAPALRNKGYEVKVIHLTSAMKSIGYNPLHRANTSSEINAVADCLVRATLGTSGGDPFWRIQAREVISMLIAILKTQDKKYRNLFNVRQLLFQLKSHPEKVDRLFVRFADPILLNQYKAFVSYDTKLSTSILASCQSALQLLTDSEIAKVTSFDSMDLESFRKKKVALFVQTSVNQMHYLSPITSLFFEQFFQFVMQQLPKREDHDIFFLLDEASTLKIPGSIMTATISNIRKYRAGMLLVFQQAKTQLAENFGRDCAQTVLSNCMTKLYFPGQGLDTTTELSNLLGKYEYVDDKDIRRFRALMTPDEIRTMQPNEAILLNSYRKPMKVKLKPFYKQRKLRAMTEIPHLPILERSENPMDLALLVLDNLKMPCPNPLK